MEGNWGQKFERFVQGSGRRFDEKCVLPWAEKEFLLKPFKLSEISLKSLLESHRAIQTKYAEGKIASWPDEWHKNERKVFIQVLLCFCKGERKCPDELSNSDWAYLSSLLFDKNPMFLKFQAFSLLKLTKKVAWTAGDDELVKEFVRACGEGNWNEISRLIFYRTDYNRFLSPKQIRQRWYNHISDRINKGRWTLDEDMTLIRHVLEKNRHWCEIVKALKNRRTEHMIKNRFKLLTKKAGQIPTRQDEKLAQLLQQLKKKTLGDAMDVQKISHLSSQNQIQSENQYIIKQKSRAALLRVNKTEDQNSEEEVASSKFNCSAASNVVKLPLTWISEYKNFNSFQFQSPGNCVIPWVLSDKTQGNVPTYFGVQNLQYQFFNFSSENSYQKSEQIPNTHYVLIPLPSFAQCLSFIQNFSE